MMQTPRDDRNARLEQELRKWQSENREWLRERFSPLVQIVGSDEFQRFWQLAKASILAARRGDDAAEAAAQAALLAWALQRGGWIREHLEIDKALRVERTFKKHLRPEVLGRSTPRETWELVDGNAPGPDGRFIAHALGLAMVKLSGKREVLPGIVAELISERASPDKVTAEAVRRLGRERAPRSVPLDKVVFGTLLKDGPHRSVDTHLLGEFVAYGKRRKAYPDHLRELARFVDHKKIREIAWALKLPPKQVKVLWVLVTEPGITDRTAGERLGMAAKTVATHRRYIADALITYRVA
jgi:hypothetical protein